MNHAMLRDGPPWDRVEDMVETYQRRLSAGLAGHELFFYRDKLQYERKLRTYVSVLRSLGSGVGPLLDVGCGTGELLRRYRPKYGYLGVDVVPEFVTRARRNFPEYEFYRLNLLEESPGEGFPTAVLVGVLGSSPRPVELLSRAAELATHSLVFDYLVQGGSAEGVEGLRTLAPSSVRTALNRTGWTLTEHLKLGSSTRLVRATLHR